MKDRRLRPIGVKQQRKGKAFVACRLNCPWWGSAPTLGEGVDLGLGHLSVVHA